MLSLSRSPFVAAEAAAIERRVDPRRRRARAQTAAVPRAHGPRRPPRRFLPPERLCAECDGCSLYAEVLAPAGELELLEL
jgi:hypothetical protein